MNLHYKGLAVVRDLESAIKHHKGEATQLLSAGPTHVSHILLT